MNKRFQDLTIKMCDEIVDANNKFLLNNLKDKENTMKVVNLVISGHISALFTCLNQIGEQDKTIKEFVIEKFISRIRNNLNFCDIEGMH